MKIHFMAPIATGIRLKRYEQIISVIEKNDCELVTRHVIERKIDELQSETTADAELYVKKLMNWFKKADVLLFEASQPDTSIGFEIATALNMSKPTIILFENGRIKPHALLGLHSEKIQVLGYEEHTLQELLELAIDYARDTADVRFNFFVTPSIGAYLDWIAQNKKIPRSVYLRNLIEDDMNNNQEYKSGIATL